jgi:hypothetical protein
MARSTTRTSAASTPAPTASATDTASAELRIIVSASPKETSEYTVVPVGGGDKARGYNVTPAHDPKGGFVLEEPAETPDAAIQEFSGRFAKDTVSVSGGGACFVVVHDEKVLACEKSRPAATAAAEALATKPAGESGEPGVGVSGVVYPATTAVRDTFEAVGTEGTRIIVNRGGLVSLAR